MPTHTSLTKWDWKDLKSPTDWFVFLYITALGLGKLPRAPGTFGTLLAVPICYYSTSFETPLRIIFWLVVTLIAIWAVRYGNSRLQKSDSQEIVIDEVLGYAVASWTLGSNILHYLLVFVFFRFFDIFKLTPVGMIDRWSKKSSPHSWKASCGIILDDLVAGLQALILTLVLQKLYFF